MMQNTDRASSTLHYLRHQPTTSTAYLQPLISVLCSVVLTPPINTKASSLPTSFIFAKTSSNRMLCSPSRRNFDKRILGQSQRYDENRLDSETCIDPKEMLSPK
jgi:hypothetical protein